MNPAPTQGAEKSSVKRQRQGTWSSWWQTGWIRKASGDIRDRNSYSKTDLMPHSCMPWKKTTWTMVRTKPGYTLPDKANRESAWLPISLSVKSNDTCAIFLSLTPFRCAYRLPEYRCCRCRLVVLEENHYRSARRTGWCLCQIQLFITSEVLVLRSQPISSGSICMPTHWAGLLRLSHGTARRIVSRIQTGHHRQADMLAPKRPL